MFSEQKENEISSSLQHGYFSDKDEIKQNVWEIQNVNGAITNILIGAAYMFRYIVTASNKIIMFSTIILCCDRQAINWLNSQLLC